eukprot:6025875-Pleurochrysis_carterae.AAC.3
MLAETKHSGKITENVDEREERAATIHRRPLSESADFWIEKKIIRKEPLFFLSQAAEVGHAIPSVALTAACREAALRAAIPAPVQYARAWNVPIGSIQRQSVRAAPAAAAGAAVATPAAATPGSAPAPWVAAPL